MNAVAPWGASLPHYPAMSCELPFLVLILTRAIISYFLSLPDSCSADRTLTLYLCSNWCFHRSVCQTNVRA